MSSRVHDHAGHAHGAHHGHGHGAHDSAAPAATRRLQLALAVILVLLVLEGVGGIASNSLALLADAGHVLTDVGALGLTLFVAWLARQPGKVEKTFGYLRWEILAALINGTALLLISAWIVWQALLRLRHPEPIEGGLMLSFAVAGLLVNGVAIRLLHDVRGGSLNVRGAYLHVLSDLLASAGTVVAAVVVRVAGWAVADPIASFLSTALIVVGAWQLVRESVDVLLEAAPAHIALDAVRDAIGSIEGVEAVHDLHVWTLTSGMIAMSAHAVVPDAARHQSVLDQAHDVLQALGLHHVTLQLECCEMTQREAYTHP